MDDPQPIAGEVRIRVAAGVNPDDVKKREDAFGWECPIRVSFRTATVRERWTWSAKTFRSNGSDGVCGVMEPNRIVLLGPLPNTLWSL